MTAHIQGYPEKHFATRMQCDLQQCISQMFFPRVWCSSEVINFFCTCFFPQNKGYRDRQTDGNGVQWGSELLFCTEAGCIVGEDCPVRIGNARVPNTSEWVRLSKPDRFGGSQNWRFKAPKTTWAQAYEFRGTNSSVACVGSVNSWFLPDR